MNKIDLSNCGQQHICVISGGTKKDTAKILLLRRSDRFPSLLTGTAGFFGFRWLGRIGRISGKFSDLLRKLDVFPDEDHSFI